MRDPWFPIALMLIVLLTAWLGILGPLPDDFFTLLEKWQTLAAATVAPNTPHVGVVWKPRLRSDGLDALLARSIISQPAASAVSSCLPFAPMYSAVARAAENTGGLK